MRLKSIIQKAGWVYIVVITDESAISDSNKFVQLNIIPDKYLNYIINVGEKI